MTSVFTPAELRRRLPRRADVRHRAVADFLDAALAVGAIWFPTPDDGTCIIKSGRAFILRFHAGDGLPPDYAGLIERLESAGCRCAVVRDFSELTSVLSCWGLARRPSIMA